MRNRYPFIVGGLFLALLLVQLHYPAQSRSQGLPEGVSVVIISEHDVNTPGVAKVKVIKMTLQPGASIENLPVAHTVF